MRKLDIINLLLFISFLAATPGVAQDTISYQLSVPEIDVVDQLYSQELIKSSSDVIPTYDLGDLLSEEPSVFIKDYGLNQLQSIQFRGLPPSHNTIFWNGVEVDNPFLRQMDLSILDVGAFSHVSADISGVNRFLQSGASIAVDNVPETVPSTQIQGSYGSFNRITAGISSQMQLGKFQHILGAKIRYGINDFEITQAGRQTYNQVNAGLSVGSFNSAHFWNSAWGNFSFKQFYNYVDREIAPVIGQNRSDAEERDRQYWSTLSWDKIQKKSKFYSQISFLNDIIDFDQESVGIAARSNSMRIPIYIGAEKYLNNSFFAQIEWRSELIRLKTNNFISNLDDHRHSLRVESKWLAGKSSVSAVIEQMIHYQDQYFTNFNLSYSLKPSNNVLIRSDLSRIHTIPSYNDLFWSEGGNPDIIPEKSYKIQLAIATHHTIDPIDLKLSFNPYYYHVDNWILWLPGMPFWSPVNVQRVLSRGFDTEIGISIADKFSMNLNYGFNKVTNRKTAFINDQSLGKQLVYSPMHSGQIAFSYRTDQWVIRPSLRYFSKLFTTRDNSLSLPGQLLGAMYIEKTMFNKLTLALDVQNVTDRNYQLISGRAQPPRYGDFIIKYTF